MPLIGQEAPIEVGSIEDRRVAGSCGHVDVRIYRPQSETRTTLIYIHGGGWVAGDLDAVDQSMRRFCETLPAVVVSCTYRLAPEHPFPAAFEDALAAAKWALNHAQELGGDASKVAIAGDSAGGNLAAAVALALRNEARADGRASGINAQLLLYPVIDIREAAWGLPSRIADADPALRSELMREFIAAYTASGDCDDWRQSPGAADDVSELPPTIIVVQTVDPLRDEAVLYASKLRDADVDVELMEFDNLTHGFMSLAGLVPAAAIACQQVLDRFRLLLQARP